MIKLKCWNKTSTKTNKYFEVFESKKGHFLVRNKKYHPSVLVLSPNGKTMSKSFKTMEKQNKFSDKYMKEHGKC